MSKFARSTSPMAARGPVVATGTPTFTFEGTLAASRDAKGDLFMLAAANMVGEDTFYEAAGDRDARFRDLVHQVAWEDFDWLVRFAKYLRTEMFMRSASIVLAAEAVHARLNPALRPSAVDPHTALVATRTNREMIFSVLQRLDEPGEILAYWASRYGRNFPAPVKRGVADALGWLVNEYLAMKYDGTAGAWRLGDIIDLVHPVPTDLAQADLFSYLLDRRHHATEIRTSMDRLPKVQFRRGLEALAREDRRAYVFETHRNGSPQVILRNAAATWEWLAGWLPGGMDAEAWEAVIPSMGYMALLRNLRNFDRADVSDVWIDSVCARLADPEQVAKSMQFPFRFFSAHAAAADSMNWSKALTRALDLSCSNIPALPGRTLVITDTSASMRFSTISERSKVTPCVAAAVFAAAVAKRNAGRVDLVQFASSARAVPFKPTASVLTLVEKMASLEGSLGHGTDLRSALEFHRKHDRIFVFSDMQVSHYATWPTTSRNYAWNLQGYSASPNLDGHVVELAGMSDAAFRLVPIIEAGRNADWPF